jgi:signal transduction protein with GAF and PtsI domain
MVETPAAAMFVHERGNRSLDGLFRLIEVAGQPSPLEEVLSAICEQVAAVAPADVVSIYVRDEHEGESGFTLRANVGFPEDAVGRVRLRLGEGIVGFVAERMRPVSVETAERDEHFK